jgi:hypothetical protein
MGASVGCTSAVSGRRVLGMGSTRVDARIQLVQDAGLVGASGAGSSGSGCSGSSCSSASASAIVLRSTQGLVIDSGVSTVVYNWSALNFMSSEMRMHTTITVDTGIKLVGQI